MNGRGNYVFGLGVLEVAGTYSRRRIYLKFWDICATLQAYGIKRNSHVLLSFSKQGIGVGSGGKLREL